MSDDRLFSEPAQRNRDPILEVLRSELPDAGLVLEIASGSGLHVTHFAAALPRLDFQPSDPDDAARRSVRAWVKETGLANVREPLAFDAADAAWPLDAADAIVCINMIHIAPWRATPGLMAGAARILPRGAPLVLYGPYRRAGVPTAPSNEAFDASLKARNPEWGLRELEKVEAEAAARSLVLARVVEMPANNFCVVFRKT